MRTVCDKMQCCGCSACREICPRGAISLQDQFTNITPVINEELCIGCDLCRKVCPSNTAVALEHPMFWYQGWAKDERIRATSASGGLAQAISAAFVENGGYVCSCIFENGNNQFYVTNRSAELSKFQGSRYVKSSPFGIYKEIKTLLQTGERVLFVGLPCQAAAIRSFVGEKYRDSLYTIDLVCHGTPSPALFNRFLKEHDIDFRKVERVIYRSSDGLSPEKYIKIESPGIMDTYSIAFLNGLIFTENCYGCRYAGINRGSDLTLGDSWGSSLTTETRKGISLVLCQSQKGKEILENSASELRDVDLASARKFNPQLNGAVQKPRGYNAFFKAYRNGNIGFNRLVVRAFPYKCFKQFTKKMLIRMGLMKASGGYMVSVCLEEGERSECR